MMLGAPQFLRDSGCRSGSDKECTDGLAEEAHSLQTFFWLGFALTRDPNQQHDSSPPVMKVPRWSAISDSAFAWGLEALELIREHLRDHEPWRAWSHFEFLDDEGRVNEVDALIRRVSFSSK